MASTAQHVAAQAERLSDEVVQPFPASRKVHVTGSRADINVPMREIALAPTETKKGLRENPPLPVYDTSGP